MDKPSEYQSRHVRIVIAIFLLLIFWNMWRPIAKGYLDTFSPTLQTHNVDFFAYYRGGQAVLRGVEPYAGTRDGQLYIYPPTFVPFYAQLARLDYDTARYTWAWIYALIFLGAVAVMLWWLPAKRRMDGLFITAAIVLTSYPVLYHIRQGQIDFIVAGLWNTSLVLYLKRHDNLSAFFLAVATLVKLNPVFFLITYVLFFRDWKYLIRYGVILLAAVAISGLFFPLDWYRAFFLEVLPTMTKSNDYYYNQSLIRFFTGDRYITRILTLIGIGGFSLLTWFLGNKYQSQMIRLRSAEETQFDVFLATAIFLMNAIVVLVFSGLAWLMAYVWFILPVVPVALELISTGRSWLVIAFTIGVAATHSILHGGPGLNAINMIGASFCMIVLAIALLYPQISFKETTGLMKDG